MPEELSTTQLLLCAMVVGAAYLVRGITGFGSGLIAIPFLALTLPLTIVVPLIVTLDYIASASQGIKDRDEIQWGEILPLLPFALTGVLSALYLFRTVDPVLLSKGMGCFVLMYAIHTLVSRDTLERGSRLWAVPAGGFGGLIGTLFGTGGPFYVLFLEHRGLTKRQFRATFASVFLLDGAARLMGYLYSGFYNPKQLLLIALGLPIMIAGIYVGGHIHANVSQQGFRTIISLLLIVSGVSLVLR